MTMTEHKLPRAVIGALIYNNMGEILIVQMKKWNNKWTVPGGHIEWGESMEDAVRREVKEETGLELENIEYSGVQESIFSSDYIEGKHLIMLDFYCKLIGGEVILNEELQEYKWLKPKDALYLNLNVSGRKFLEKFIKDKFVSTTS